MPKAMLFALAVAQASSLERHVFTELEREALKIGYCHDDYNGCSKFRSNTLSFGASIPRRFSQQMATLDGLLGSVARMRLGSASTRDRETVCKSLDYLAKFATQCGTALQTSGRISIASAMLFVDMTSPEDMQTILRSEPELIPGFKQALSTGPQFEPRLRYPWLELLTSRSLSSQDRTIASHLCQTEMLILIDRLTRAQDLPVADNEDSIVAIAGELQHASILCERLDYYRFATSVLARTYMGGGK